MITQEIASVTNVIAILGLVFIIVPFVIALIFKAHRGGFIPRLKKRGEND